MSFRRNALCTVIALTSLLLACGEPDKTTRSEQGAGAPTEADQRSAVTVRLEGAALVDDWMSKLSLQQKVDLLSGVGMSLPGVSRLPPGVDRVPGAAGYTVAYEALDLKSTVLADGPAGLRIWPKREGDEQTYYATAFPVATALASSWDTALLESVGSAMGEELRDYGVDVFLAPGMNIHRNPLGGRNFEYYSEDPLLSGRSAAAMVNGIEAHGVGATIKHYAANNQETNRFLVDTLVSERALREVYLRGFEIAVKESQPWAIMSAYNRINGSYASQHEALLETVLRGEWGFEGLVMTDWFSGDDPVAQVSAGNDLLMPGMPDRRARLQEAAASGELPEATVDRSVRRILTMVSRSRSQAGQAVSNQPDLAGHARVARIAAAESVVLLKNDADTLPLAPGGLQVAVFGRTAYDFISGGTGSGDVNEAYTVSLVAGLEEAGFQINPELKTLYRDYVEAEKAKQPPKKAFFMPTPLIPEMTVEPAQVANMAASTDIALITIGRDSGEFQDRPVDGDFTLSEAEHALIDEVSAAFHAAGKKAVVILNVGNVLEIASWRDQVDAILLPWQGGQEAGNAIADVLTGKVNPSGKLATTFPVNYADVPSAGSVARFPGIQTSDEEKTGLGGLSKGFESEVRYEDGIFVGYRYFDTFGVPVAYPFGYGLSYTDFDVQADPLIIAEGDSFTVNVTVTNTGDVDGREVVQLYVAAPKGTVSKPRRELRAFGKTGLLAPGTSETLAIEFSGRDLASFDPVRRAWVTDAGEYTVSVAVSLQDERSALRFIRGEEGVYDGAVAVLAPDGVVDEIKP